MQQNKPNDKQSEYQTQLQTDSSSRNSKSSLRNTTVFPENNNKFAILNHQHYDHVFKIVFENLGNLLSLYNALAGTNYTNPNDLIITTLKDAVFIGMKNDLSFVINNNLNLFEHQSTINLNMPLRALYYISDVFKSMYYGKILYQTKQIKIIAPKIIMFYNGAKEVPDQYEMRLSDAFIVPEANPDLEVVVHVININEGHNQDLFEKCSILKEYSIFSARIRQAFTSYQEYKKEHLSNDNTESDEEILVNYIKKAIDSCIRDNILTDILQKERNRVMETILSHFNADEYISVVRNESFEDGFEKGQANSIRSCLLKSLEMFGDIPNYVTNYINIESNIDTLNALFNIALQSSSVEEFWQKCN